jgi:hypothetical protein
MTNVAPDQQPIVAALRDLMSECAPEANEVISYGSPAWRATKILAIISVSTSHITFAFERGAEFTDDHGLLQGVGKKTRHVKLKSAEAINQAALRDYVEQAVVLDARSSPRPAQPPGPRVLLQRCDPPGLPAAGVNPRRRCGYAAPSGANTDRRQPSSLFLNSS